MGLEPDADLRKDHLVLIISMYWAEGLDTKRVTQVAKNSMDQVEAVGAKEGALLPWK